jgi:hypothetical protein
MSRDMVSTMSRDQTLPGALAQSLFFRFRSVGRARRVPSAKVKFIKSAPCWRVLLGSLLAGGMLTLQLKRCMHHANIFKNHFRR